MLKLGSHVSFKSPGYLKDSVIESINNGANTMMIYLGPPQNTKRIDFSKLEIDNDLFNLIPSKDIIVHAPYIVNLANFEKSEFGKEFLINEIKRMNLINSKYLVLHPGATLKQDPVLSRRHLAKNIASILEQTKDVEIILETMSGKGTEIGSKLEEIKEIIDLVNNERVGICLDTCHMWDAGYDLKTDFEENDGRFLFEKLKSLNLMDKVKVIHLNDSKNELSSHKDRHANIGKGMIGLKALINFALHPMFDNVPIILETPYIDDVPPYKEEIELIKKGVKK